MEPKNLVIVEEPAKAKTNKKYLGKNVEVRFEVSGPVRRLDSSLELAMFRIGQEALRNIELHADASRASVEIEFAPEPTTASEPSVAELRRSALNAPLGEPDGVDVASEISRDREDER